MNSEPVKMQGLGNKFIVFKGPKDITNNAVIELCKEHDTDGLLLVSCISNKVIKMKYWNADGSIAEMCGNGLRCVTRYAVENKLVRPGAFTVMTDAGPLKVIWDGKNAKSVEVQIGKVITETSPLKLHDLLFYKADVGNPHAVTFVNSTKLAPVRELGPTVEADIHFPNRTNVEFVELQSRHKIKVRTWERGVGETLACGTGMVAAANMAVSVKGAEFPLEVEVIGGKAKIWLDNDGYSRMVGPAMLM